MQILIPDSWLRDYLETEASPKEIQNALSLCGPSIDRLTKIDNDHVYDIEVTTNRVDCMSVLGTAFEAAAILPRFGFKTKLLNDPYKHVLNLKTSESVDYLKVKVAKDLCFRFSAVLLTDVKVGPSPKWLSTRLELAGLRSLNNVIDISNYLMLAMGQPVHTFDYDKITGSKMILRESTKGEKITTLDGKNHLLPGKDIVIEDDSGKLIDLCGIMGGLSSAVTDATKNVLLFVQVYEPHHIRRTSMSLPHRTAAAVLFEKNLPVENVLPTLKTGIDLFAKLTGGRATDTVLDILNVSEGNSVINLETPITDFTKTRLGIDLTFSEISQILSSLEFVVKSDSSIEVPWARKTDVLIPEDLVEEIARIYGYHNMPSRLMTGALPTDRNDTEAFWVSRLKHTLKHWGFTETYTYSLTSSDPDPSALKLKNPLSDDWKFLRTTLTPSLKNVIAENLGRVSELNIFEIANVYLPQKSGLPKETLHLAIATTKKDWLRLKGIVQGLFDYELGVAVDFIENNEVIQDTTSLIFEINLSKVFPKATKIINYQPISKFSPIIEDVNLTISESYDELLKRIHNLSPLIVSVELKDKYGDKLTLQVTYHSAKNQLSNSDVAPIRKKLMDLK